MSNKKNKVALITGITGQDGAYLTELLLERGYEVHGIKRRTSIINTSRIDRFFSDIHLHYGDMTDGASLRSLIESIEPDEIYNLAAMSHVQVSFKIPEYVGDVDGLGTLRLLDAINCIGAPIKIYQASTSELFGKVQCIPQNESTPFYPRSPYGVAKLYAYWITVNYREAYNMFASNGILFNHESPLRGETFVTRKITRFVANYKKGDVLKLGNLEAKRDWGHAKDFVRAMWLILQHNEPDDFVISTGKTHSVREFVSMAFDVIGKTVDWDGDNGYINGILAVTTDDKYRRPTEVDILVGDSTKAKNILGWEPEYTLQDIIKEMVDAENR